MIVKKLEILECLLKEYLQKDDSGQVRAEAFLAETVGLDGQALREDMEFYQESLNVLEEKTIRLGSRLLEPQNRLSLLAMMVYSYQEDKDLEDWLTEYAGKNGVYLADQKQNFFRMKNDFEKYCRRR